MNENKSKDISPAVTIQIEENQPTDLFAELRTLIDIFSSIDWNEVKETLLSMGKILVDGFSIIGRNYEALEKLSKHQFVYFGLIPENILDKLIKSNEPDIVLFEHLQANNFDEIDGLIVKTKLKMKDYKCKTLYSQSVSAYRKNHYSLACVGFTTILDNLLTAITKDETHQFRLRLEKIYSTQKTGEIIKSGEIDLIISALALNNTMENFVENSNFEETEPKDLNRHWISHGRSTKNYSKLDCIKLLGMVYSVLVMDFVGKGGETDE